MKNIDNSKLISLIHNNCDCSATHNERFVDRNHRHIVTGELRIIKDSSLYEITNKGTKYRAHPLVNKVDALKWIRENVEKAIMAFKNDRDWNKTS